MSWKSRAFAKAIRAAWRDTRPRRERPPYTPVSLSSIAAKLTRDTMRFLFGKKRGKGS